MYENIGKYVGDGLKRSLLTEQLFYVLESPTNRIVYVCADIATARVQAELFEERVQEVSRGLAFPTGSQGALMMSGGTVRPSVPDLSYQIGSMTVIDLLNSLLQGSVKQ